MPNKGKLVSLISSDEDESKSKSKSKSKWKNKKSRDNSNNSMDIDISDDNFDIDIDFDIDKDNSSEPNKKILRKRKNHNKHKKIKSMRFDESDESNESDASEQSLISLPDLSPKQSSFKEPTRRTVLQRFKDKVGNKRKREDIDSDESESDTDYDDFGYKDEIETAFKYKDGGYDGSGLKSFYRDTLGIQSESSSDQNEDDEIESMEPNKKRRKLNDKPMDKNKLTSNLAKTQLKESFGGLPISSDLMGQIARYLTLIEISQILVLINHTFCQYFNTDRFWEKLYSNLSKTVMNKQQIKLIKQYKLNKGNKLYKRRLLWYYTRITVIDRSNFDDIMRAYIPSLKYSHQDIVALHKYYVDRMFMIKLYLIKECAVMHYKKKYNMDDDDENNDGIDTIYRYQEEAMNIIIPRIQYNDVYNQYIVIWNDKYKQMDDDGLYNRFQIEWRTQNDIFNLFRYVNQLYIDYKLNDLVAENVKDLQYLSNLQRFYQESMGNATNVIRSLCDDNNTIHESIDFDEIENDKITVTIESPKIILHEQLKYIMQFINNYNNDGKLQCKLFALKNELNERNIISSDEQFENIKILIDRRQFKLNQQYITYKGK